jgi:hypothetical protein
MKRSLALAVAFWRSQQRLISTSTTHRSSMKMVTAIAQMMAMFGTPIGWCWHPTMPAARVISRSLTLLREQNLGYRKRGPVFRF